MARASDVAYLVELERSAFGSDAWSDAAVRDEVDGANRIVLVVDNTVADNPPADTPPADVGDGIVGWAAVLIPDEVADLARIAVDPLHRGRGIGRLLLWSALQMARDRGAIRMMLEVAEPNAPARALYEGRGFRQIATRRAYYADGSDAVVMERIVEGSL